MRKNLGFICGLLLLQACGSSDEKQQADPEVNTADTTSLEDPSDELYKVTAYNSGLEISLPGNFLPDHSYDADWIYRIWQAIAVCTEASQERVQSLRRINIYREDFKNTEDFGENADPFSQTTIDVNATDIMPDPDGNQGLELGRQMERFFEYWNYPVDGELLCGFNHSGRRHAIEPLPAIPEIADISQDVMIGDLRIVVRAKPLLPDTLEQLAQIADVLTRKGDSGEHTPLSEIRVVADKRYLVTADHWSNDMGGYSVNGSYVMLLRDSIPDDLYQRDASWRVGYWIDAYRRAYEDDAWGRELGELYLDCCLPIHD
ncbi:MAG: hypothetical protein KDJ38_18700 [Gammaproteobacteria bacterium]|nr:hypothetical protein [Gammaproteobacteria bacterium]